MTTKYKYLNIIPNAIPPYGYEFVNILCLPRGVSSRFRFKEKWVSDEFKSNYKSYLGKTIHVLLRDKETAKIIPLRKAITESISKIGDTYYIRYSLLDCFEFDSKVTVRDEQLSKFSTGFYQYNTDLKDNEPDKDMYPLVFGCSYDFEFVNKHFDADETVMRDFETFENIIRTVKDIDFFKSVTFTKIISLRDVNKNRYIEVLDGKYQINEETDYELSLYQTTPTLDVSEIEAPNDIELKADNKYITIIKGKQRAVGKYDVMQMLFRTNINTSGVDSFIDITYKLKPGAEQYIDPNISIPVHINLRFRSVVIRIAVLIVSIILYSYSHLIKAFFSMSHDFIKDLTVITAAVIIFDLKNKLIEYFKRK